MQQPSSAQYASCFRCDDDRDGCPVSDELTAQCTDQCVVIACHDPGHAAVHCDGQGDQAPCNLVCDSSTNCVDCNGFDDFLQCCVDYHSYLAEPQWSRQILVSAPSPLINGSLENLWCNRIEAAHAVPHQNFHQQHAQDPGLVQPQISGFSTPQGLPEKCMWHDCKASFSCLAELVGHVNLVHLYPPPKTHQHVQPLTIQDDVKGGTDANSPLSCLWDDCSLYLSPENIAGTSNSSEFTNLLTALESHLLHDHLGLQTPSTYLSSTIGTQPPSPFGSNNDIMSDVYSLQSETSITPQSPSEQTFPSPSPPNIHPCLWKDCGAYFLSPEELTAHLTSEHVGSGKARYDCFWRECDRHEDRGFGSKQKICRHLQSHTGYRPFQCEICKQNFSEAATLQQHMRRHTQEKPYACDFPGCGKSFAIMGALTIHKRIHNGQKPFKCTYCGRAFTESSNLSKHLRTHTGARPYSCSEPGCEKSFARPDQLTRHLGVHSKASPPAVNSPKHQQEERI